MVSNLEDAGIHASTTLCESGSFVHKITTLQHIDLESHRADNMSYSLVLEFSKKPT